MSNPRKNLKALRLKAGLSVSQLARKANLDRATVASAETGKPKREVTLSRLAIALNSCLDEDIDIEAIQ